MVVVGGEFGFGGGCWPVAWWWQGGHFHVVAMAILGLFTVERETGRKEEREN